MNEEKRRQLVYYVFIVLAFIVLDAGILVAWNTCKTVAGVGIFLATFIYLVSLAFAGLIVVAGASYEICGSFKCPGEEYVEAKWWGE
jgi:uncharacterized Tic20 family protein